MPALLSAGVCSAEHGSGCVLPDAADRVLRRDRFRTWHRLESGGFVVAAGVCGMWGDRADAGPLDGVADAATVAGRDAQSSVPLVCAGAGRRRLAPGTKHCH